MVDLGVITRCVYAHNLCTIKDNLRSNLNKITYKHYILIDESSGKYINDPYSYAEDNTDVYVFPDKKPDDRFNVAGINCVLQDAADNCTFIYVLDDDNIIKENFQDSFMSVMDKDFVIFDMERKKNKKWEKLRDVDFTRTGVDFAHYVVKSKLALQYGFPETPSADRDFARRLYVDGIKPFYAGVTCVYYNKLNPNY